MTLRTIRLLPQKGFRRWAPPPGVSPRHRQPATGPPGSYPGRTYTGKQRRARLAINQLHDQPPVSGRTAGQAKEIIAFADYWKAATGSDPGLLVFDSQLTTYKILDELTSRRIKWLTLRQRGKKELAHLAALPASAWKTATITRSGRYRRPRLHEDTIKLTGVSGKVRQIAVKNIGRDEPTLLISNEVTTTGKDLFARYAERMMVENELDAYIGGFHLDALTSGVPLNCANGWPGCRTRSAQRTGWPGTGMTSGPGRLPLCPMVAVDAQLAVVGEVAGELPAAPVAPLASQACRSTPAQPETAARSRRTCNRRCLRCAGSRHLPRSAASQARPRTTPG